MKNFGSNSIRVALKPRDEMTADEIFEYHGGVPHIATCPQCHSTNMSFVNEETSDILVCHECQWFGDISETWLFPIQ
ncbi:hypothetical protein AYK24_06645 [Thermoplasmatales archaeon SG8-52-4]|nr:MAG: hypothetical protein AYK24_06645 [Thermoplasmatales archaeon SG8-52-4]